MQAIREIGRLQDTLRRLGEVPRRAAAIASPKLTRLLQRQYRTGVDPYGRPWAPLRPATLQRHGPPPLTDTRAMRAGTRAMVPRPHYAGIRLVVGAPYGYFHQVGFRVHGRRVPARRILPQYGLPATWLRVLQDAARQAARAAARGR